MAAVRPFDVFSDGLEGISLIEASAGTGKTWNICGLYLRLLLARKLEVQKILVVTFTNAATAELRDRIRSRIAEVLECLRGRESKTDPFAKNLIDAVARNSSTRPEEMRALLEAALGCFDEAAIYTIHSFCQRALGDTPLAAGLPYGLELIEDDAEVRHEAVADFWRREVSGTQGDPDLAAWLAVRFDSPVAWSALLKRLQAKPLSKQIWPDDLDEPVRPLRGPLHAAFAAAKAIWEPQREAAIAVLKSAPDGTLNRGLYKADTIDEGARLWDAWLASDDPLSPLVRDDRIKKPRLFSAAFLREKTNSGRTTPRHAFFDAARDLVECRLGMEVQLERLRLRLLCKMATETVEALREKKRARRAIAFDDILYNAWEALCKGARPWLAAELRNRYPAALIDEFQDTDPLQCAIFLKIYDTKVAPGLLFLVGDPKQAIYSFRNADLHTYLAAKKRARKASTLLSNQRSVEGLIQATNALFAANPGAFIMDSIRHSAVEPGDKKRMLLADRSEKIEAPMRIWQLPVSGQGEYLSRNDAHKLAVQATAGEISRLLGKGAAGRILLDGQGLRGGDIAVLVRTHRQGRWIKEALAALGVGAVELSPESIFATRDAEDVARVLSAILEPAHRRRLLAALATEFIGLSASALEVLSRNDAALAEWTARLDELRATWLARGFGVMFRRWIDEGGVSRRLLARRDGERRMTNLLHLGELLHRTAAEQPAPAALLRWLATQRVEAASGEETQVRLESDRNLVQIVTIHKAKGLEYPFVFCPFAWDGFLQVRSEPYAIEYHDEDGGAVIDFCSGASAEEPVKTRRRTDLAAERVRLIYVALTRAIHRCYLIAGCYLQGSRPKQSTNSVLNWLAAKTQLAHEGWSGVDRPTAEVEQSWKQIGDDGAPHILLTEIPLARGKVLPVSAASGERLSALPAPARIDTGWRIGSFSAIASGAVHEAAAADHDARTIGPVDFTVPDDLPAHDILRFPRGPSAGDCLHAMFERADFMDPSTWDGAIQRALALHPQRSRDGSGAALQRRMLQGLLEAVIASPLQGGVVLGKVSQERRLNELGFHLPAQDLSPARLNAWLRSNGYAMPRLSFDALRGYLNGYIDLTFEFEGRYYVLDWKSNHLGYSRHDYGTERMAGAMQEHGYYLQASLYSAAVNRYLAQRLAGYEYERHFGGVFYLFVRGVRPGWVDANGAPLGVWFHRPAAKTLASLDALLAGRPEAKAA